MSTLTDEIVSTPEGMKIWQRERMIFEITERICELMTQQKPPMTRSRLAKKLGKSPAHVTQLLTGDANMTIRTVADLFTSLGRAATLRDTPISTSFAPSLSFSFASQWHQWPARDSSWQIPSVTSLQPSLVGVASSGRPGTSLIWNK